MKAPDDCGHLMARMREICQTAGGAMGIRFLCRPEGPLLVEISLKHAMPEGEQARRALAVARELGVALASPDRVVKLVDPGPEFRCPRRQPDGRRLADWCYDCRSEVA